MITSFVEALGDQTLPTNDGKLAKAFLNVALDTIDEMKQKWHQ